MLAPKRVKHRKVHRGRMKGKAKGHTEIQYGKKPAETRMGSGKGNPEGWVAVVKPGRVMFELSGVNEPLAREAMLRAQHKLPIKTKFITRVGE
ncbi:MAG: 50S ribosomal protein L16 [Actinobacteria bacterium]|nr:MAG: 50S ribosomal protein L16 [Actinomycetota bacterium]